MRYRLGLLLVLLVTSLPGMDIQREPPSFTPLLKLPTGQQPATIQSARYELTVRGLFSETSATYTFSNPNPRPLPGELEFPLPDGATVCGYALDVDGQLVDGVVVAKDEARMILETESRVRRDPGLVEQVRGNLYRTRIFPLPAMGTRTVRITWTAELERNGQGAAARLLLPRARLPSLDLHVDIGDAAGEPVLSGLGNLHLTTWQDRHVADCHLTDVQPGDDLRVDLPTVPSQLTMVEDHAGEIFIALAIASVTQGAAPALPAPPRIAVAWDAGASRTPEGIARAQAVLVALMQRWPKTTLDIVDFRDVPGTAVACRTPAELSAHLTQSAYDGGTSLAALDLRRARLPDPQDAGWILVSDGIGVLGDGLPQCGDAPVTVLACESVQDAALLEMVARASGGQVVDARAVPAAAAAAVIAQPARRLLRVDADPGMLMDVQISHRAGCDLVLARLARDGEIRLFSGVPGGECSSVAVPVRREQAVPGSVITRAWAGAIGNVLAIDALANHDALLALGQRYGVVTAGTSLLVLERLDQYLRYAVEPPPGWPAMRQAYLAALKGQQDRAASERQAYQDKVARRWQERVAWWRSGQVQAMPAQVTEAEGREVAQQGVAAARTDAAAPVPQPAPASSPAAANGASQAAAVRGEDLPRTGVLLAADDENSDRRGGGLAVDRQLVGGEPAAAPPLSRPESAMGGDSADGRVLAIDGDAATPTPGSIAIAPFRPDAPYLRELSTAEPAAAYATYLRLRLANRASPSFYLDCANAFLRRDPAMGHRILSNLLGLRIEDPGLLRIVAWRLSEAGDVDTAIGILRHVLQLRPEEPQSYRDLASALAIRAETGHRAEDLEEAMGLLMCIVRCEPKLPPAQAAAALADSWTRCPDIDLIALEELNRDIARAERGGMDRACAVPDLDQRLRQNLDCDLRVAMGWDQDQTDIDLHVIEPSGEEAFYGHRSTASGGLVSQDNTVGYGPEEYVLRHAPNGTYRVCCNYFASHTLTLFGAATVTAAVYLDWGRPTERRQMLTLRLDAPGESVPVGAVEVKARGEGAGPSDESTASTQVNRDQIAQLHIGAKRAAVEAALGAPMRVDQDGITILLYRLTSGETVRLGFGPDLVWAREIQHGAERDLVR